MNVINIFNIERKCTMNILLFLLNILSISYLSYTAISLYYENKRLLNLLEMQSKHTRR